MSSALKITLTLSLLLSAGSHAADTAPRKTLAPFASEQALSSYLQQLQARQAALLQERQKQQQTLQRWDCDDIGCVLDVDTVTALEQARQIWQQRSAF